jgi:hypothetical protein
MIFKTAHKKPIINALGTPNRSSTVKYKTKTINNCSNKPMK